MLIYAAISEKAAPDIAYNCTFVYQLLANVGTFPCVSNIFQLIV